MIIDLLREKYPHLTGLRVREITVDKQTKKVFCTISLPDAPNVDSAIKRNIVDDIKKTVPEGYYCVVSIRNDSFSILTFQRFVIETIQKRYPVMCTIKSDNVGVNIEGNNIFVTFKVNKVLNEIMEAADFENRFLDYCSQYTSYSVAIDIQQVDAVNPNALEEQEKLVQLAINKELLRPSRYFTISQSSTYIGKKIKSRPMYIVDVREPKAECVVCGTISDKSIKPAKSNPSLKICKFSLSDASGGKIPCILFARFQTENEETIKFATGKNDAEVKTISQKNRLANEKLLKKLMELYEGTEVLIRGKVVKSAYSGQLEMQVYDISKCVIATMESQPKFIKTTPAEYLIVTPEKFEEYRQTSFTDSIKDVSYLLREQDFVVINTNATGSNPVKDKIFALAAVKISNGHISESFFTYVNPERVVEQTMLDEAQISNEKLPLFPTLTELVGDIYKFCQNAVLVGMNVTEVLEFLRYYATPVGYVFDNKTRFQNDLISDLYENSTISKKANCSRLDEVAKSCKITYDGSNFCQKKSIVAAKCIVRLSDATL